MFRKPLRLSIALLTLGLSLQAGAQSETAGPARPQLNLLKVNLPGLFANNYSLQYERVVNRKLSVAVSYRWMPKTGLPFKNTVLDIIADDAEAVNTFQNVSLSGTAITPELRIYLGKKGYGRGFYFAPYYRYSTFEGGGLRVDYDLPNNTKETITLSGKSTAHSGGLMMGAQWSLGPHMVLDWWILGAHYGSAKADMAGRTSRALTQQEQDALRQELLDRDIPIVTEQVSVNANGARVQLDGPWSGVRAGLSLGIRL